MTDEARDSTSPHLKALVLGGGIVGGVGALFGYAVELTEEGAAIGFVLGWVIGEVLALSSVAEGPE